MKEKKVVLLSAGSMSYRVNGIYDSEEDLLEQLREDWGDPDLTIDDLLEDNEYMIESGYYYKSKSKIREEKIDDVLK